MTDKYYTPTIEEFRVGFEYESQDLCLNETCWVKEKYQGEELRTYLTDELERKEIRVKQLDKEDIESLGFTFIKENIFKKETEIHKYELLFYNNQLTTINVNNVKETMGGYFFGTIKNKSELQIILKQLTIL